LPAGRFAFVHVLIHLFKHIQYKQYLGQGLISLADVSLERLPDT